MKELVDRIRTTIYLTMCILFSVLIYIYIDYIFKRNTSFWLVGGVIIAAMVVIDYLSRRHVTNLVAFFLIHLALIAFAVIIPPEVMDKIVLGIIAFAYLVLAIGFWRTEVNERSMHMIDMPVGMIMFFVLIYIHASISKSMTDDIATYAYIAGVTYFILYYVREYMDKLNAYSLSSGNFSDEMKNTFATNFSMIALFNLVVVLVIMISNIFFSDSIFNVIGRFLRLIARKFFGFLEGFDGSEPTDTRSVDIRVEQGDQEMPREPNPNPAVKGSNAGEYILEGILIVLFIVAVFCILLMIYKFIKQYLHRHNMSTDVIEKTEFKEKRADLEKKSVEKRRTVFASNSEKIRKLYAGRIKNILKKNDKIIIQDSFTTDEISKTVVKHETLDEQKLSGLTELYRKARYSDKEITKEEVDAAKEASKS